MKKAIMFHFGLLLATTVFTQGTATGIDFYGDQVSNTKNGPHILYMTKNDTIVFKLANAVEIDGHYYNSGGETNCEFHLVFVLDQVWISDCENNRYRSINRCNRANCTVIHLECIERDQTANKSTMLLDGLNIGN